MPGTRKRAVEAPQIMCDNHPNAVAAHTTESELHQPISLCEPCLRRIGPWMRTR